ncbi:hypothetical protein GCM10010211_34200 [Streptomyces albospinus]|uniref:Metallo-beta-lactamase domain-containing protein n=1 Tax=Streptomyces albospinus TaxID=285515 RepID=A0ABQ2V4C3_9ACTN|nr:hypothetical protein [Streptomyces albospinus]GGU66108.1 hypothetical protein GCM10010211_34200 [Streptomyces albospinus]
MPVKVVFFNVGQGDCTLITFYKPGAPKADAAVLLDCGSKPGGEVASRPQAGGPPAAGTAKQRLIDHLRKRIDDHLGDLVNPGVLDYLLISHPDEDHFNLLGDVLLDSATKKLRYTLNNVWYSMASGDYKEGNRSFRFMETLLTNPASLTSSSGHSVVHPPREKPDQGVPEPLFPPVTPAAPNLYLIDSGAFHLKGAARIQGAQKEALANLSSLVLVLTGAVDGGGQRQKVLLMADALKQNEKFLIDFDKDPTEKWFRREKNLWLKVGHHGSKTSTCKEWLEHTTPDGLFVSTGPLLFGGRTATCTDSDFNDRMLGDWETVRTAHGIPDPKVTSKKPLKRHWGHGYQGNTTAVPWQFGFQDMTGKGVFSTLAGQPLPPNPAVPGSPAGEWTGRDWILWIDRDGAGTYEISYE